MLLSTRQSSRYGLLLSLQLPSWTATEHGLWLGGTGAYASRLMPIGGFHAASLFALLISWLLKQLTHRVAAMQRVVVWFGGRETLSLQFHALGQSSELRLNQQHSAI